MARLRGTVHVGCRRGAGRVRGRVQRPDALPRLDDAPRERGEPARPRELATTVDAVEKATGFDFFSKLPLAEQAELEAHSDFNEWER